MKTLFKKYIFLPCFFLNIATCTLYAAAEPLDSSLGKGTEKRIKEQEKTRKEIREKERKEEEKRRMMREKNKQEEKRIRDFNNPRLNSPSRY